MKFVWEWIALPLIGGVAFVIVHAAGYKLYLLRGGGTLTEYYRSHSALFAWCVCVFTAFALASLPLRHASGSVLVYLLVSLTVGLAVGSAGWWLTRQLVSRE